MYDFGQEISAFIYYTLFSQKEELDGEESAKFYHCHATGSRRVYF